MKCEAAKPSAALSARAVGALLASCSEDILPEAAMAEQKGAGLRPPSVISNETSGSAKVMLWDEMKTSPLLNPPPDGVVTSGIGGR